MGWRLARAPARAAVCTTAGSRPGVRGGVVYRPIAAALPPSSRRLRPRAAYGAPLRPVVRSRASIRRESRHSRTHVQDRLGRSAVDAAQAPGNRWSPRPRYRTSRGVQPPSFDYGGMSPISRPRRTVVLSHQCSAWSQRMQEKWQETGTYASARGCGPCSVWPCVQAGQRSRCSRLPHTTRRRASGRFFELGTSVYCAPSRADTSCGAIQTPPGRWSRISAPGVAVLNVEVFTSKSFDGVQRAWIALLERTSAVFVERHGLDGGWRRSAALAFSHDRKRVLVGRRHESPAQVRYERRPDQRSQLHLT